MEKASAIKELDDRVVGLRREIGKGRNLYDVRVRTGRGEGVPKKKMK